MAKKLRIAVLYNEPFTNKEDRRKYVSANGQLQEAPRGHRSTAERVKARRNGQWPAVDLSEVGVLEEMEDIKAALTTLGYKPCIFNVDGDLFRLLDYLRENRPDLIFNLVECVENESIQEMNVAGIYELLKIPYTGANPLTLGIALHKHRVKEILSYYGIRTPRFQLFRSAIKITVNEHLKFPLIVKPSREDASVGIAEESVVYNLGDLRRRVRFVFEEFDQPVLVEEYIVGREINAAVLGSKKPIVLPLSEIDFSGLHDDMHKIVSYEAKWMEGTVAFTGTNGVCPANLPARVEAEIRDTALKCFHLIGCRDYARVDFRLTEDNVPYVLEVNPNPDISDDAGFARSARTHGFTFPQIIGKIVESALERQV
jgi:D-alanine-D-alanine ligase